MSVNHWQLSYGGRPTAYRLELQQIPTWAYLAARTAEGMCPCGWSKRLWRLCPLSHGWTYRPYNWLINVDWRHTRRVFETEVTAEQARRIQPEFVGPGDRPPEFDDDDDDVTVD